MPGTATMVITGIGEYYTGTIEKKFEINHTIHDYETVITKATMSNNGSSKQVCSVCGDIKSSKTIYKIASVKLSEKKSVWLARISVIVISIIAIFLALDPKSSVFQIVSFAWAGFGAAFGPVVLFALFWKRTTKWGAFAGMLSGGAMVFFWKLVIRRFGGIWDIYELLPAFIISLVLTVVVSLVTPAPSKEIQETFEAVKAE